MRLIPIFMAGFAIIGVCLSLAARSAVNEVSTLLEEAGEGRTTKRALFDGPVAAWTQTDFGLSGVTVRLPGRPTAALPPGAPRLPSGTAIRSVALPWGAMVATTERYGDGPIGPASTRREAVLMQQEVVKHVKGNLESVGGRVTRVSGVRYVNGLWTFDMERTQRVLNHDGWYGSRYVFHPQAMINLQYGTQTPDFAAAAKLFNTLEIDGLAFVPDDGIGVAPSGAAATARPETASTSPTQPTAGGRKPRRRTSR